MALFSGYGYSLPEVSLFGQASLAAFVGGPIPAGWSVVTPTQLGLPATYSDGNYFTDPSSGASAIVLQQGTNVIVAFRGTDSSADVTHYPELINGSYIQHYAPLLTALAADLPPSDTVAFTGASLGGAAANELATIAGTDYGGRFASSSVVAFASPVITNKPGVLNLGFENDPIYKALNGYSDSPASLDHLVAATSDYMAGDYDGRHPLSDYAHNAALSMAALGQLSQSVLLDYMNPDSVLIFDENAGPVRDITPGRENVGAFYLGQNVDDVLVANSGNDYLEGFGGNDYIAAGAGNDQLFGGPGNDALFGEAGNDLFYGGKGGDQQYGGAGFDKFYRAAGDGSDFIDGGADFDAVFFVDRAFSNLTFIGKSNGVITAQFGSEYVYMTNVEALQFTDHTLFV